MAEGDAEGADSAEMEVNEEEMEDLDAKITEIRKKKFEEAVSAVGLRVDVGGMIWQSYLCFEEALLGGDETNEKQIKTIKALYKRALRVPNVDLADTWKNYLEFAGENLDEDIKEAHEASTNLMKEFSKFELKLAETDDSVEAFYEYLNFEKERAGAAAEEIDEMWISARETISSADDGRALYRTYLYMLRRRADATDKNFTKVAEVFEEGAKGRQIWDDILASGGGRFAEKWIEAVKLERQFGTIEGARKLLYKALNSVSDHPTVVFEYFIQFEREEGTLEQLDKALEKKRGAPKGAETKAAQRKRTGPEPDESPPAKKQVESSTSGPAPVQRSPSKDKDGFIMPMLPVKKVRSH
ncbi:hypothetical protein OESDEN_20525 [Oesophagostomum dentatum]|uniref:Suppressor of forked domain-containing protein n=1 Tax=Oesophagostomum dentatum TaxID=61180 RepID=A0A0B1S9B7_OESDE|nr:hypothetical protein OESDEN_20525 [Oesophagostomum dentatum]